MTNVVSGTELRDRLLKRLESSRAPASNAWIQALAVPGNQELLALIANRNPQSIGELSELAGRAQPNVSRSLATLVSSGLIEVRTQGRVTVPALTALGKEKAKEIGVVEQVSSQSMPVSVAPDVNDIPFFSVTVDEFEPTDDVIRGNLAATFNLRGEDELTVAAMSADLNAVSLTFLDHWWRIFYRRDAPYKVGDFVFQDGDSRRISITIKSIGNHIERSVRSASPISSGKQLTLLVTGDL